MKHFLVLILLFVSVLSFADDINLDVASDNLDAFMRVRGNKPGEEVVFSWTGYIYSFVPGERAQKLFKFYGFNIGKVEKSDEGYKLITREAAFYQDVKTGEIIEKWMNPFTEKEVEIIHVWNDPVNQNLKYKGKWGEMKMPFTDLGETISFNMDLFLRYPSPLPRKDYPLYSTSDWYEASELFQFFSPKDKVLDSKEFNVPCTISWTRISPWLPWMEMADAPGHLVYQCAGKKLVNGYNELPQIIKDYVAKNKPEYQHPPKTYSKPNETSWTYAKKMLDKRNEK